MACADYVREIRQAGSNRPSARAPCVALNAVVDVLESSSKGAALSLSHFLTIAAFGNAVM